MLLGDGAVKVVRYVLGIAASIKYTSSTVLSSITESDFYE